MISTSLPVLSMVALVAAQSSTVSLYLPFADPQSLVASIAGSDSTATSYVVNCAISGTSAVPTGASASLTAAASASATSLDDDLGADGDNECGLPEAITIIQGPSTVHYSIPLTPVGTASINCQLMGTTQAVCTAAASGAGLLSGSDSIPRLTTATLSSTDVSFLPVVITAGSATAKQTGGSTTSATAKTTASADAGSKSGAKTGSTSSATSTVPSSSAKAQSTNAAMQGSPAFGAGVLGALGVAVAGAIL